MRQQWLDVPASELLMLVASSASLSGSSVSSQVASLALMALLLALVALVAFIALMVSFSTGGFHSPGSSVSAKNLVTSILRPRPGISYLEPPHNKRGAWLLYKAPWIGSLFGWQASSGSNQRLAQGCPLLWFWWVWWWLDCGWPCLAPLYQSLPLLRGRLWLCLQNTQHVEIYFFFGVLLCRVTFGSLSSSSSSLSQEDFEKKFSFNLSLLRTKVWLKSRGRSWTKDDLPLKWQQWWRF